MSVLRILPSLPSSCPPFFPSSLLPSLPFSLLSSSSTPPLGFWLSLPSNPESSEYIVVRSWMRRMTRWQGRVTWCLLGKREDVWMFEEKIVCEMWASFLFHWESRERTWRDDGQSAFFSVDCSVVVIDKIIIATSIRAIISATSLSPLRSPQSPLPNASVVVTETHVQVTKYPSNVLERKGERQKETKPKGERLISWGDIRIHCVGFSGV